jgi:hypothetical protein
VRHAAAPERRRPWWALSLLMLAAAGLLFWAPWEHPGGPSAGADRAATEVAAGAPAGQGQAARGTSAPAEHLVDGPIIPARLQIPALRVDTKVEARGTVGYKNAFTGRPVAGYGVPTSMRTTSWWSDGPRPGSGQMAVILGHTQVGGYGVFNRLGSLHPGSTITLRAANGDALRLTVLGSPVTGLDKSTSALADTLNGHPAGADVAFVTCGGAFDQQADASEDNVVVFASVVPVG